jgi:uncharacterized protein (TIGR02453 family)
MAVATATFTGFESDAIDFLAELAMNNDREWFNPRKAEFERLLKAPMEALVAALADRLADRGIPLQADPKRSIFRIYRDTRFAKDKSPYKTNLGASFPWLQQDADGQVVVAEGMAHANGGYFNFQPGEMYVGGGMWMPEKKRLDAFRRAVVDEPERVHAAIEEPGFVAAFGSISAHEHLKRVPPGFPPDHPDAELLRYKDIVFGRHLSDAEVLSPALPDTLADAYAAGMPVFRFLDTVRA